VASRLPLLDADHAPLLARIWYRADGSASALTRSLATAPDVMETLLPFLGQILGESAVDLATKELVIMRVSELSGCRYCLAAHRPAALQAGIEPEHLDAVCGGSLDVLPERERAIVEWVDQVTLDAAAVTDDLVARLLDHVRQDQLVEITLLAGAVRMLNQYCTAFAIPPPG
jgi:AhpD family alkylhydroperoxidase